MPRRSARVFTDPAAHGGDPADAFHLVIPSLNVAHWSEFGRGGHFAALEALDLLTADIRDFFCTLGH